MTGFGVRVRLGASVRVCAGGRVGIGLAVRFAVGDPLCASPVLSSLSVPVLLATGFACLSRPSPGWTASIPPSPFALRSSPSILRAASPLRASVR